MSWEFCLLNRFANLSYSSCWSFLIDWVFDSSPKCNAPSGPIGEIPLSLFCLGSLLFLLLPPVRGIRSLIGIYVILYIYIIVMCTSVLQCHENSVSWIDSLLISHIPLSCWSFLIDSSPKCNVPSGPIGEIPLSLFCLGSLLFLLLPPSVRLRYSVLNWYSVCETNSPLGI